MLNAPLRLELIEMSAEDLRVRQELVDSGELGGEYVPRMEQVHIRNAERLKELIALYGWPNNEIAGEDGALAAWLIAQHAIGAPLFQRACLALMKETASHGRIPRWHMAYLEDRIAMLEGRPQIYGTQWMDDPVDGQARPWRLVSAESVDELRAGVGLGPMPAIPERGPALPGEQLQALERSQRWWEDWLASKGWRE